MDERELVELQAAVNDDRLLERNFMRYIRIPRRLMAMYNIRGFDRADWYQEARIAHFKAVQQFNGAGGSQFGCYYRLILSSHFYSLMRRAMAQKRIGDLYTQPQALLGEDDEWGCSAYGARSRSIESECIIRADIEHLWSRLSATEAEALRLTLSGRPNDSRRHRQAMGRVRVKIKAFLYA
ncbi:hypothetical protein [Lacticaseibacillus thailandensis]|uniref:RNA polymerase sigma-70 region 2 domain-containing protein n=1 Tax=Lacticaseibacillus thailandensis DSM 22698 = JCM 13996 TaxID=1423810 RepID=A0A0R2C4B3_9LACO|nr:hypothetical protein [Lacticaseibacillus thailandensis]KRM86456.1 hypothetical protein FD19_GL000786 [Lacticaseibacillus thailandensis DSM 22698 = JCM 13996]